MCSQDLDCTLRAAGGQSVLRTGCLTLTHSASIGFSISLLNFICSFTALNSFIRLWHLTEWDLQTASIDPIIVWVQVCVSVCITFALPLHTSQYPGIDSWLAGWSPCCCAPPGLTCSPQESVAPCSEAIYYRAATISQSTENQTKAN